MAPELELLRRPYATYGRLAAQRQAGRTLLWRRPLLVCLVLGVSIALAATGRASAGLVAGTALCWSFVPAVQMAAFALVARGLAPPRAPTFSSAADLFFMGHLPWSLWLLLVAGATAFAFPEGVAAWPPAVRTAMLASAAVPAFTTVALTFAFWRAVLALPRRRAALATAAYHGLVWGFALLYSALAAQFWPRLLSP
jgi:hypothetical protein